MGSSSSKYLARTSSADHADVVHRTSSLVPGLWNGKDLSPKHDSELKSTRESGSGKVWGHDLLSGDKGGGIKKPVGRPPYHDDYEEVIEVYTEEILPIEEPTVKKAEQVIQPLAPVEDVPTIDLPPCQPRCQDGKHGDVNVNPSTGGGLPPKSPMHAFTATKSKKARPPLRSIEDIRLQQHERIMEQMRKYDAPARVLQVTQSDNCTDPAKAYDVMKELKDEDENLEQVTMKVVASEGSKKTNLKGKPQAWTKSAKSSSDTRSKIAAVVSATFTRAGRVENLVAASRKEAQRASSASDPADTKIAQPPTGGSEHGVTAMGKAIRDLDIL